MTVREYLTFCAALKLGPKPNSDRAMRVDHAMKKGHVDDMAQRQCGKLSKDYRQRVGLAQAILHDPEVLILDEATSGLDPNQLIEIRNLIKNIGKEKTVILSTHIMQEVEAICNRVLIINKGKIIADDSVQMLRKKMEVEKIFIVEFKTVEVTLCYL
jgi:ABC-2 type transport system ATP-binding protein